MTIKKFTILACIFMLVGGAAFSQELPKPTYANSLIVSIEHNPGDAAEVDYLKTHFNFGLYAWLSFSVTAITPVLDWHADLSSADAGLPAFKDPVNSLIAAAKAKNVKLHIVLCSGLARGLSAYREAKDEDIRNAQWYNDNNLATDAQLLDANAMDNYVFGTLSRYARKLRDNLEAKAAAVAAFMKLRMTENPDTLIAVSGWGEVEMNYRRINNAVSLQDFFCDYSPFAVLEFRDWIQHAGLYDDATGKYRGQGYTQGGAKYQGAAGLAQFNADYGTGFTSWDLRYFNWSLADDYDPTNRDYVNADPRHIPVASYAHNGMRPTAGANFLHGGFDPPRTMQPGNAFYDLWALFRETMVRNFVADMGRAVQAAGISPDRWFSHQIPGDYLFGTSPAMDAKNARYYSSASPLWTANIVPFASVGATIYDVKFSPEIYPPVFARTTKYIYPDISSLAANWAVMEFDPEVYPQGLGVAQSGADVIVEQFMRPYYYSAHLINFWRWVDATGESQIKGMNKEIALRDFVQRVRDKARSTDMAKVYDPPKVIGLAGQYVTGLGAVSGVSGVMAQASGVRTQVPGKIWANESWDWKTWGDFAYFEVYRGSASGFAADDAHYLGRTSEYVYNDVTMSYGGVYYYRWRAVNAGGLRGPLSDEVQIVTSTTLLAVLSVDRQVVMFGAEAGKPLALVQKVLVKNTGAAGTILNWSAAADRSWILATPALGTGDGLLEIRVNTTGLGAGAYTGKIMVQDPNAANSPLTIEVVLNVYEAGQDSPPFGSFDTPLDGATGVSGSIAVTGWALDDIQVAKVEIKRNLDAGDPAGAEGPDGLVYLGDAVFVKGARRDVEASYAGYPNNDRAGWGYMLLTNFFPNQGNGTFVLFAFAVDGTGHRMQLGQKLIVVDNKNAMKPFGAIDTPAQGAVISGTAYDNFGWALTPQPKIIPPDGSTIWVFVDGQPLGHPAYGFPRTDIDTKFPGFRNSGAAVGLYTLDTTMFANGVHSIAWSVTDGAGVTEGIGSRFFEIQNSAGAAGGGSAVGEARAVGTAGGAAGTVGAAIGPMGLMTDQGGRLGIELGGRRNSIEIEELERIVLRFKGKGGSSFIGWGENEGQELPLGSTLDIRAGVFYWMPGPGFLGRHLLHFSVTDGLSKSVPVEVVVTIVPKKYGRARIKG
jgi:hypothetical protein